MEDVKEPMKKIKIGVPQVSFNPCFNGRCKRTGIAMKKPAAMTACFNPCFNGRCKRTDLWQE